VQTLSGSAHEPKWPADEAPSTRGHVTADAAVQALRPYWKIQ